MKNKKQSIPRLAGKALLRMILSTFLCVFLYLSMSVLTLGVLGQNVGYRIIEQKESGEVTIVEEYYYQLGEAEVTSMELPEGQSLEQIREVSSGVQVGADVVTQIIMLLIVGAFLYSLLWNAGDKDSTSIRYRGQKYDALRGLKIGLLATLPYFVLYVVLWLSKLGLFAQSFLSVYRLINLPFLTYINWIVPTGITTAAGMSVWQLLGVLPTLLVVPAVCCVAYIMGTKQISVQEHVTYVGVNKGNENTEI